MSDRIGVLCGGPSREREISLRSGKAVHEALASLGLPSILVPLPREREQIPQEIREADLNCAFIALHGAYGEDGTIQALLEEMRLPYTGSPPDACRYGMNKVSSRLKWLAAGLPVPHWKEVDLFNAAAVAAEMKFPLVVKPVSEGSSLGMSIVDSAGELQLAVETAASFSAGLMLEEYLPGPELTVGILDDRPLPVIQIVPKRRFYDTIAKYTPGQTEYLVPAPIPPETARAAQELALRAHEALGCRSFSRVDMILTAGRGPVLLELNTIPGMTETSLLPKAAAAAGIPFTELCRQMLNSAWVKREPAAARSS
ncbi:MAG: D-alanine--D-alanine ligase [Candidatus Omnitrophota bacterium]|nr:D-alanine--D-alanine ligase [Candidatus Omnitrophota bacterium]